MTKELNKPPTDGVYKTRQDSQVCCKELKTICKRVLIARQVLKIGCQMFRKTAYGMAIFGDADRDDLKMSARHSKKSKDAPTYSKDAAAWYELHERNPHSLNNVRKWSNIRIQSEGNAEVMAQLGGSDYVQMTDLPHYFVHRILKVAENHPLVQQPVNLQALIPFLLEKASKYVTCDLPQKKFDNLLKEMSPERAKEFKEALEEVVVSRVRTVIGKQKTTSKPILRLSRVHLQGPVRWQQITATQRPH